VLVPHSNHAEAKELFGLIDPRNWALLVVKLAGVSVAAAGGGRPAVKFWDDP
jgi:predicted phosphoadenosine phosphosulfate sulfurtransferase